MDLQLMISGTILVSIISLFLVFPYLPRQAKPAPWFADANPAKAQFEKWSLLNSIIWITSFAIIILCQLYEDFDATT